MKISRVIINNLNEYGSWKPSNKAKREFAEKMKEIDDFCDENGISQSASSDSYYFNINGQNYRVSNHTVAASNRGAFNDYGEQKRGLYHPNGEEDNTIYITASKTRIIDIYNALKAGKKLDRRGNIINESVNNAFELWKRQISSKSDEELLSYQDKLYNQLLDYNNRPSKIKNNSDDLLRKIRYVESLTGVKKKLGRQLR